MEGAYQLAPPLEPNVYHWRHAVFQRLDLP
jgi:hypothetical protein